MGFLFGKKKKEKMSVDVHIISNIEQDEKRVARELEAMKKEWAKEKETRNATHDRSMASLDFSRLTPSDQPAEFSDTELEFLKYVDGLKVAKPKIAKRWTEQGIDFQKSLEKFFTAGVLQFNENRTALKMTTKGTKIAEKYDRRVRNVTSQKIGYSNQEYLTAGQIGLYRNNLLTMSGIHRDEGHRSDELRLLLYACHFDLFGFSDLASYKLAVQDKMKYIKPSPMIAPGVIQRIEKAAKALSLTPAEVEEFSIRETFPDSVPPDSIVDIPTGAKLVRMYLEGQGKEADELLKRATAKYIKAHQK